MDNFFNRLLWYVCFKNIIKEDNVYRTFVSRLGVVVAVDLWLLLVSVGCFGLVLG